mmetsp:Transcript_7152/g.18105  ORF Transcript_7152/g.18105 Transcript_7152/m.18105 type:complete len:231 (-) Transcript_7152:78-770(-)
MHVSLCTRAVGGGSWVRGNTAQGRCGKGRAAQVGPRTNSPSMQRHGGARSCSLSPTHPRIPTDRQLQHVRRRSLAAQQRAPCRHASGVAHRRAPASGFYTYNKHRETPGCAFRVLPVCPSDGQPGGRQLSLRRRQCGRGAAVCEGGAGHPQLRQRPHSRVHLMKKPPHIWRGVRGQVRDGAAHLWVLAKARTLVPAPHPPASAAVRGHVQRDGVCVVQNDGFPGEGLGMG